MTRLSQPENLSSHWTIALAENWFLFLVTLVTLLHFVMAAVLPPAEDELYYWAWAQDLAGGYYDHPPMVAWLIRFSCAIFGDNLFGIRFFACVAGFVVIVTIGRLARKKLLPQLLLFTPLVLIGSILMTPDVPLLLFWALYVGFAHWMNDSLSNWEADPVARVYHKTPIRPAQWIAGGVVLGLGCLSKYTMLLAIPCGLVMLLFRYRPRAWLLPYALHLLVALVVASPAIAFNARLGFEPFLFQWGRAMGENGLSLSRFLGYVGAQCLLVGPLPFLLFPFIAARPRSFASPPGLAADYFFFVVPALFFAYKALTTRMEANWAIVCYVSFWGLAQRVIDASTFRTAVRILALGSFALPLLASLVFFVHWKSPWPFVPPEKDRVTQMRAQYDLFRAVAGDLKAREGQPVFASTYQQVAYLRFLGVAAEQYPAASRKSQFTLESRDPCAEVSILVVSSAPLPDAITRCFASSEIVKQYDLVVREKTLSGVQIYRFTR